MATLQEVKDAYASIGRTNIDNEGLQYWLSQPSANLKQTFASIAADQNSPASANAAVIDPGYKDPTPGGAAATISNASQVGGISSYQPVAGGGSATSGVVNQSQAEQYVRSLYASKGISNPDQAGVNYWTQQYMNSGDPSVLQTNFNNSVSAVKSANPNGTVANGAWNPTGAVTTSQPYNYTVQGLSDYLQATKQQAQDQAQIDRYNQFTPTGNQIWSKDAQGNWTLNQNLSPDQQQLLNSQTTLNQGLATGLQSNLANATNSLAPIDQSKLTQSPTNAGLTTQDALTARLNPEWDRQRKMMDNNLANQGIGIGSEAWNAEQNQFNQARNDAYQQAGLAGITADQNARSTQIQQEIALQNQPLNAFNSLRTGLAAQTPNFNATSTPNAPDYTSAVNQATANQTANNNANIASQNSLQNGLFGLGATAISTLWGK